jgi:FKBP-type peptidyl-prolyl cis-trans isomerase
MKKLIIIPLFFLALTLSAQRKTQKTESAQTKEQPQPTSQTTPQTPVQEPLKLTNGDDSTQYIIGAYLGQFMLTNGLKVTNANLFIKGIDDVLAAKPMLVPADSVPKSMAEHLSKMTVERNKLLEKQLFDAVRGQPGVGTLPNGVCYVIAKAGTGTRPMVADSVIMHVKGYLPEGILFEDTYAKNTPLRTTPGNLIPGLKDALQIMTAGSVWRIYIPSALAYAEKGVQGIIPPYSAIVFDVELLTVKMKK